MYNESMTQPVVQQTVSAIFDMCPCSLKHPQLPAFFKKRTEVRTTSGALQNKLHQLQCQKNHDHVTIEWKVKMKEGTVSASSFSAHYSSKFAQLVASYISSEGRKEARVLSGDPEGNVNLLCHDFPVAIQDILDAIHGPCGYHGDDDIGDLLLAAFHERVLKWRRILGKTSLNQEGARIQKKGERR